MVKKVFTKKPCKRGKVRQGKGGRCVRKCKADERRKDYVCRKLTKKNYTYNELSRRFVKNGGPTAKWIRGNGPAPFNYYGTYEEMVALIRS